MRKKTIEIVGAAWVLASAGAVFVAVNVSTPPVYLTLIFSFLLLTLLGTGYLVVREVRRMAQSSRRYHEANVGLQKTTQQGIRNLEASRVRAAAKSQDSLARLARSLARTDRAVADNEAARARDFVELSREISHTGAKLEAISSVVSRTDRAVNDSEAARARATIKLNGQLNEALAQLEAMAAVAERLRDVAVSSHNLLVERADHPVQLAEALTRHAVKMEMYLDEIRNSLDAQPSHKEKVLAKLME